MSKRWHNGKSDSGSLLASVFIMTLGAGGCLFTVSAMAPHAMPIAIWSIVAMVTVFVILVMLQRLGKVPQLGLGFLLTTRKSLRNDGLGDYLPRKAGEHRHSANGTNQPISAAEAHEIQVTSANTWVPAQARNGRPR